MRPEPTDGEDVASVENVAFGPIFESRVEGDAFLHWYERERMQGPRFDALHIREQRAWIESWRKRIEFG